MAEINKGTVGENKERDLVFITQGWEIKETNLTQEEEPQKADSLGRY